MDFFLVDGILDRPRTLAEAMAVLEKGLKKWFEEQGIEVE